MPTKCAKRLRQFVERRAMVPRSFRASAVVGFITWFMLGACQIGSASGTPAISNTSPASVAAGSSGFTLIVNGSYFSRRAVVQWNGSARSTTWINGGQLRASISAADIATAGNVQVTAYDSRSRILTNAVSFTVTGTTTAPPPPTPIAISTSSLPNGTVSAAYAATLTATGGTAPYTWAMASGSLPAGLTLAGAGSISGTPTTAGTSSFYAQTTDSGSPSQTATSLMSITVAPLALKVTTTSLPNATVSVAYSATLAASGGTAPYTWSIVSGQLPAGVALTASTGVIAGTPTLSGSYPITVKANDSANAAAQAALTIAVTTQTSSGLTPYYATTSFWNTPIPANPSIDPNSSSIIASAIAAYASNANFANTDSWGIGLAYATSTSKVYSVACTQYCSGSVQFPIPAGATPTTGSDHHLVVINGAQELDMWNAVHNSTNDTWSASFLVINNATGWGASCAQGLHCNGAVAAGFGLLGGQVRPEEIAQGHIDHALSITTPDTRSSYIACPATHDDGKYSTTSAIPEGAQIQLDPAFNVDAQSWPAWEKIVAKALQKYGAFVSDTGGSMAIRGFTDVNTGNTTWLSAGTPKGPSLSNLPWSSFRVLSIQSCN
jgi:hypothetical protein